MARSPIQSIVGKMSTLGLALAGDYDSEPVKIVQLSIPERRELCQDMEGRLRSRTAGLMEAIRSNSKDLIVSNGCFCGADVSHDPFIDGSVDFLHRIVFEFLCQDHVWQLERLAVSQKRFNTATALSLAGLHLAM
ncbi:hypothetical protein CMUS01_09723 [Colletotrichum musicola]|uniref:DUF7791 domain-containing protein n=1 Tax=Colletotrichum musicola TaxID=2175873 RepID=A0A8H6K745_9PEZI|nr:hypothetical protein CMUS01_09723 [Colletotrichum musicola]